MSLVTGLIMTNVSLLASLLATPITQPCANVEVPCTEFIFFVIHLYRPICKSWLLWPCWQKRESYCFKECIHVYLYFYLFGDFLDVER